jgi:hypothetical protein
VKNLISPYLAEVCCVLADPPSKAFNLSSSVVSLASAEMSKVVSPLCNPQPDVVILCLLLT